MLGRALLRAQVPVAFSGGFNPRPRLSIPLPRSVGTQSVAERLCAVLSAAEPVDGEGIRTRLNAQLPAGCRLQHVQCAEGKRIFHPAAVRYVFSLESSLTVEQREHLAECKRDLEAGHSITVQRYRTKTKTHEPYEISGLVEDLCLSENAITVFCRVSREGSARIDELMQWLHLDTSALREPVLRAEVQWEHEIQEHN